MRTIIKATTALWKFVAGAVLCQFAPTSILVIGWTYRAMQRRALRTWRKHSPLTDAEFNALAKTDPLFAAHTTWPNWFIRQSGSRAIESADPARGIFAKIRHAIRAAVASLGKNLRVGLLGAMNTTLVTAVPAILCEIGWYTGWDNSFNKGYEQYYVGIILSWIGILFLLVLMTFLPMAQARQAITGSWRAFYDLRTIWSITRNAPVRALLLAAAYSLVLLPVSFLLVLPVRLDGVFPQINAMNDTQLVAFLAKYYFWLSVIGFAGFVFVRMLAAKWYARTIVELLSTGHFSVEALKGDEVHALHALRLDVQGQARELHPAIAATLAVSRPLWRNAMLAATVFVWFTFIAQSYVREFFNYHPVRGLTNQPLVQLPWFRYIPRGLVAGARAEKLHANAPKTIDFGPGSRH